MTEPAKMTEEAPCARCMVQNAVVDCMNCVGRSEKGALPLCQECNHLIHQGFLQNHTVRSIAIKKSISKVSDQVQNFMLVKDYLNSVLSEMKFIRTDVTEQEESKVLQIHKVVTEAHQSLKMFEESLSNQVREAAKDKLSTYVTCEEVIQSLIKEHQQITDEINETLKNEETLTPLIIQEMEEKMTMFDSSKFHKEYSTTLLPFTCVLTPIDFASSIKLLHKDLLDDVPNDVSTVENPGDKLSLFVESRMDGRSNFWASRDFTPEMTQKLNDMARKIREDLILNASTSVKAEEGRWCIARYEDNRWYRAKVEKVKPDKETAIVRWLDYAHNSEVPFANLKELKKEFQTIPVQAVKCRLFEELDEDLPYDVRWNFTGITKDKTLDCTVLKVFQENEVEIPTLLVDLTIREDPDTDVKQQLKNKIIEINNKKKDPISCRDFRLIQQVVDDRAKQTTPEPLEKHKHAKQKMEAADNLTKQSKQEKIDKQKSAKDEKSKKGSRRSSPLLFPDAEQNENENPKKARKNEKGKKNEKKKRSLEDCQKNELKSDQPKSEENSRRNSPQHWGDKKQNPGDDNGNMNPNANVFVPRNSPPENSNCQQSFYAKDCHFQPVDPPSFADVLKNKLRSNRVVHPKYPDQISKVNDGGIWSQPQSGRNGPCDMQYYHPQAQQVMHDIHPQLQPCHPDELQTDTLLTLFGEEPQQNSPEAAKLSKIKPLLMPKRDVCKFVNPDCFPKDQSFSQSTLDAFNLVDSLCESGILIGEQGDGAVLKNIGGQLMSKVELPLEFGVCQKRKTGGKNKQGPQVSILKKSGRVSPVDINTRIVAGSDVDVKVVTDLDENGTFWAVMIRTEKQQSKFSSMLNELSLCTDILSPSALHSGKLVAVGTEDGKCSRARILKISGDLVHVRFVDTGMKADMSHDQIKRLDEKFQVYPFQAMECSIGRGNFLHFSPQSRQLFHEEAFQKKLKARVDEVDGCLVHVTLLMNSENVPEKNLNFKIWSCELSLKKAAIQQDDVEPAGKQSSDSNTAVMSTNTDRPVVGPITEAPPSGEQIAGVPASSEEGVISNAVITGVPITNAPLAGGPVSCAPMAGGPISCAPMSGVPISGPSITSVADLGTLMPMQNPMTLMLSEAQPSPTMISTIPSTMPVLHGLQPPLGFPMIPFITAAPQFQEVPPNTENSVDDSSNQPEEDWSSEEIVEKPMDEKFENNNINPAEKRDYKFRPKFGNYRSNDRRSHPIYGSCNNVKCYKCLEFGHMANFCQKYPKRKVYGRERKK